MTKRMKMGYVEVEMQPACNLFPAGVRARGHVYHFSEIVQVRACHDVRVSSLPSKPKHIPGLTGTRSASLLVTWILLQQPRQTRTACCLS